MRLPRPHTRAQPIAKSCPMYVSGSADLHGSNKNYIAGGGDFGVNLGKRCVRASLSCCSANAMAKFIPPLVCHRFVESW